MDTNSSFKPWGMELNTFCMLMHLSQLAAYIIPFAGIVLPIVMWATNKDQSEIIDKHGKNILNWIISATIYFIVCWILIFVFIGLIGMIALGICSLVFIILGSIKANEGEVYQYPLSIPFLK